MKNVPEVSTVFVRTFLFVLGGFGGPKWSPPPPPSLASISKFPSRGEKMFLVAFYDFYEKLILK